MSSVLIVDDDIDFSTALSNVLTKKGYETTKAESGLKALEIIKEKAFDVVLMDIKMPVMKGVETFKKLKEIKKGTTVIMMTAFSVDDLIRDAINEGAYAVIRKPFEIETLVSMIERSKDGALIAVVDDDPEFSKSMKHVLERKGYGVVTCSTSEEAIACAKERKFDVFFIDMKLSLLNGLETYLNIKKYNPKAIAIIMTGYYEEMADLVQQAIEKGAYTCLHKPFNMDEVVNMLEQLVERKKGLK